MALVRSKRRRPNEQGEEEAAVQGPTMVGALVPVGAATARASKAAGKEMGYRQGMPTPSPLRRLEDPVQSHVLPSRKKAGGSGSGRELMPPPAPRPRQRGKPAEALDEETFVEAMGEIIERDFFPELPRLQRQMKWLESLEARRLHSLTDVRRAVQSEMRRDSSASTSASASVASSSRAGGQTPLAGGGFGSSFSSTSSVASSAGDGEEKGALPLSLDQYLARFQSEDDAAFDVLAEKMRAAHRRKYWWVYEPPQHLAIEAGKEKLYLLPSGEFMSAEARAQHVAASDAKPRLGDDRPNAPETWPYRPRNALMFPAELEETAKIYTSKQEGAAALGRKGPVLLLTEDGEPIQPASADPNSGAIVPASGGNARVGQAAKPPKAVVHNNTRFTVDFKKRAGFLPSPLERLASDVSSFSTDTSLSSEAERAAANDTFVAMTPLLIPGAEGDVPIMTWGEVGSTPLRVPEPFDAAEEAAAARREQGVGFHIKGPSHREKVASALEAQARRKGGSSKHRKQSGSTPLVPPGKRDVRSLTPAAQSLAAKLAGALGQQPPGGAFGGGAGSQLRASYGGASSLSAASSAAASAAPGAARASSSRAVAMAAAARGAGIATPQPSPMRAAPVKRAKAAEGGGANKAKSGITEDLLNI